MLIFVIGILQTKITKNIKSFLIAERQHSTAVIVAAITATLITGGLIFGTTEKIFQHGLIFYLTLIGIIISVFIISECIAPKISTFYDCISIGDIMQKSFGKEAKIFIGIASLIQCIMMFSAQISALGYILSYFFILEYKISIIFGTTIIVAYSVFGGIKSATITDIIQFGILMIAMPMICNTGLLHVGGYIPLLQSLPDSFLYFGISKKEIIKYIGLFFTFIIPTCGPYTIQRLLMTQNTDQAVKAFRYSACVILIYYLLIILIALSILVLEPDLEPNITLPFLIDNFLPSITKIIAISGLSIIIITSSNAILNAGAMAFVHDIIQGLNKNQLKAKTEIMLAIISSFIIATSSVLFTMNFASILDIILYANEFWSPIALIPLIIAIYKIKITKANLFGGIIAGFLTTIIWKHWSLENILHINGTLPGILANLIFTIFLYNFKLEQKRLYGRSREI
jgi:SSS family solute:Na+ symporter